MQDQARQRKKGQISPYAPLDEIDKKMLAYKVECPAITDVDLAELVGIHRPQVTARRNRKMWQDAFDEAVKPHDKYLEAKKQKAVRMYWKLASSKNETIAERVLSKLLVNWKILRLEANQQSEDFDPIVIKMPIYNQQVVIQNQAEAKEVIDAKDNSPAGT